MSEQTRYVRLGLFVLVSLGVLVAAVAVLGGYERFARGTAFETYINESVQGLDVGSPVKYRGVQVGKVTAIDFVLSQYSPPPDVRDRYAGVVLVRMEIQSRKLLPQDGEDADVSELLGRRVQAGLRVRVASMSIAGPSYLEVDTVTGRTPPLMAIAWVPNSLYLPSGPSTGTQVLSAVERLANQLEHVHLDTLLADFNQLVVTMDTAVRQADIPAVSTEVTALAAELRQTNQTLQSVLGDANVKKTVLESARLAASLRRLADRLNALLADPRLEQMMEGFAAAAIEAGPAAADVRQAVAALQRMLQTAGRDVEAITASLRTAAASLDSVAREARDNPSRLLFSQPPPRSTPGKEKR